MKDDYRDDPYRPEPLPLRGGPPSDRRYYDYPPPPHATCLREIIVTLALARLLEI